MSMCYTSLGRRASIYVCAVYVAIALIGSLKTTKLLTMYTTFIQTTSVTSSGSVLRRDAENFKNEASRSIKVDSDQQNKSSFQQQQLELVHIPKTGGSAIEYVAAQAGITWGLCHWQARPAAGPGCTNPDWLDFKATQNLDYKNKVEYGWEIWHTPPAWLKVNSPYRNKTLFAIVRNPYERFLSEFYCPYNGLNPVDFFLTDEERGFVDPMATPVEVAREMKKKNPNAYGKPKRPETRETLNQFLMERLKWFVKWTAHYLPQADYIYDEHGNQVIQHVLHHENLTAEFAELMQQYHLPVQLNSTVNQRDSSNKRMGVHDLYSETIRRINEVAKKDFLLLGYKMLDPSTFPKKPATSSPEATREASISKKRSHGLIEGGQNSTVVDRVYYINLAKNKKRREQMESWLGKQSIPFHRVEATVGSDENACVEGKQDVARCRGISGLAMTELDIIRNYNTSGLTLVFEDDFVVKEPLDSLVKRTLAIVPADWDVIRWDCWGDVPPSFQVVHHPEGKVFRTALSCPPGKACGLCGGTFCGGTHAMLWRDSSLHKLENIWSRQPFEDVDVRLTTHELKSYCANMWIGKISRPEGERSDIPKTNQSISGDSL